MKVCVLVHCCHEPVQKGVSSLIKKELSGGTEDSLINTLWSGFHLFHEMLILLM